jgi:hypothetical protein
MFLRRLGLESNAGVSKSMKARYQVLGPAVALVAHQDATHALTLVKRKIEVLLLVPRCSMRVVLLDGA